MATSKEGNSRQFEYACAETVPLPVSFGLAGFYFTFDDQIGEVHFTYGFTSPQTIATPYT